MPIFELVVSPPLNLVCFRHKGGDKINEAILNHLNALGKIYITFTKLDEVLTLRISIGQATTERTHVQQAGKLIFQAAEVMENHRDN